jgi:hypothetical protein
MATTTTNFGWDIPQSTDLVKDGATAIAALGQDIDTAMVDLKGGTTGQVLAKASGTDLDFSWVAQDDSNAIQNTIVDAKGDLIAATAADTPARLAIGTNGQVLTADSTAATGMKWAAAAGGGKILQVVGATYATNTASSSSTYADTGLTATITPSATTSKIIVLVNQVGLSKTNNTWGALNLVRNGTQIFEFETTFGYNNSGGKIVIGGSGISYLDSPSSTSALTYKTQFLAVNGASVNVQDNGCSSTIVLMEVGV